LQSTEKLPEASANEVYVETFNLEASIQPNTSDWEQLETKRSSLSSEESVQEAFRAVPRLVTERREKSTRPKLREDQVEEQRDLDDKGWEELKKLR